MSRTRHAMCKLPLSNRTRSIPISIKPVDVPSAVRIIGQVEKVSADVSVLQKNMAVETAARNELEMTVEQLKAETAEAKKYMAQEVKDVGMNRGNDVKEMLNFLMKTLPCKSLVELDWLIAYIENRSSQWVEYLKFLGGSDFNSAIKRIINSIMDRPLQKQLSWTGQQTTKPSLKIKYKQIVDGIHIAMNENFKDYTIVQGETKIQAMLTNARKCKS